MLAETYFTSLLDYISAFRTKLYHYIDTWQHPHLFYRISSHSQSISVSPCVTLIVQFHGLMHSAKQVWSKLGWGQAFHEAVKAQIKTIFWKYVFDAWSISCVTIPPLASPISCYDWMLTFFFPSSLQRQETKTGQDLGCGWMGKELTNIMPFLLSSFTV
jgi:hypothetical protein